MNTLLLLAVMATDWPVVWPEVWPIIESPVIQSAEREYAAPIPDSLASYDVHELSDANGNPVRIVLEKPVADEVLTRIDGPAHPWPHQGCLMCLGNHAIQSHGQSAGYLRSITYDQWEVLHDNLHNESSFTGISSEGEGWIGYEAGSGYSSRPRLFRRWRR